VYRVAVLRGHLGYAVPASILLVVGVVGVVEASRLCCALSVAVVLASF
jgi:hypothetical protein